MGKKRKPLELVRTEKPKANGEKQKRKYRIAVAVICESTPDGPQGYKLELLIEACSAGYANMRALQEAERHAKANTQRGKFLYSRALWMQEVSLPDSPVLTFRVDTHIAELLKKLGKKATVNIDLTKGEGKK